MLPGPDQVVACPHCGGFAKHFTLLSGNLIGATLYTDGKRVAPMLPHPPPVVRCNHCKKFYWLKDARRVGQILSTTELSEQEYYDAISVGLARDAQEEKALRILAWWRQNDEFRQSTERRPRRPWRLSPDSRANMEALLEIVDDSQLGERLVKAELLRQLGEFDRAIAVLATMQSPDYDDAVSSIRLRCNLRDPRVEPLGTRGWS